MYRKYLISYNKLFIRVLCKVYLTLKKLEMSVVDPVPPALSFFAILKQLNKKYFQALIYAMREARKTFTANSFNKETASKIPAAHESAIVYTTYTEDILNPILLSGLSMVTSIKTPLSIFFMAFSCRL